MIKDVLNPLSIIEVDNCKQLLIAIERFESNINDLNSFNMLGKKYYRIPIEKEKDLPYYEDYFIINKLCKLYTTTIYKIIDIQFINKMNNCGYNIDIKKEGTYYAEIQGKNGIIRILK